MCDEMQLSLDAVRGFKTLAADPSKRQALVHDMVCLGGLVLMLDHKDISIVLASLETLLLLADSPQSVRSYMKNFIGMMEQLQAIKNNPDVPFHVKDLGQKLHDILSGHGREKEPLHDSVNQNRNLNKSDVLKSSNKNSFFQTGKSKIVTLQIRGLNDREDSDCCRNLLLHVKGVISFTFDFKMKRCVLRTKVETMPEALVHAISRSMTMTAQLVVKDENGDEMLVTPSYKEGDDKENTSIDYPAEDEIIIGRKPVAKIGSKKEDNSWFSLKTVGSFLSNSFYW